MRTVAAFLFALFVVLAPEALATANDDPEAVAEARLERVRQDPNVANDPSAIEALERDANAFPAGRARVEARMVVAEAWLGRLRRPDAAIAVLRKVTGDPAADPLTVRFAEHEIVDTLISEGRLDEAAAEARSNADRLEPRFVAQTRRLVRRRTLRNAAIVELAVFTAWVLGALMRAQRRHILRDAAPALRKLTPVALAFAAYIAGIGGLLASQYESGNAGPFLLLGAGALPLVLVARAWAAVGSNRPAARIARALLCGVSVIATAFVLLDTANPTYLEGFGL